MNLELVCSILEELNLEPISVSGSYVRCTCPFVEQQHVGHRPGSGQNAFSIHFTEKNPFCTCFSCGEKIRFTEMLIFLSVLKQNQSLYDKAIDLSVEEGNSSTEEAFAEMESRMSAEKDKSDELLRIMEKWYDNLDLSSSHSEAHDYLFIRRNCLDNWLRYDPVGKRIVFGFYDFYIPKFLGAQGRTICNVEPKAKHYMGSRISETFFLVPFDRKETMGYVLVEGPFDCLRVERFLQKYYSIFHALALCGCQITKRQTEILSKEYKPVFIMLDNDEAGKKGAQKIYRELKDLLPSVKILNLPDRVKDPDELNDEQFKLMMKEIHYE